MIRYLEIECLCLRDDARNLEAAKIGPLADSIAELGLINPLRVRAVDGGFEVIAGAHRLQAAKTLGLVEIACDVVDDDDLHAELAMIDENLCRAELSVVDRVRQVARRKALYEALHPETRHGATGGGHDQSRQVGDSADRFSADTARMTGQSERKVQRDAERGAKVADEVLEFVRVTPLNTGRFLDSIKNRSPGEQMRIAKAELAEIHRLEAERKRMRVEAKKHAREQREQALGAMQQALPDKRFGVIYADPEWRFETYSRETGMDRAADNHYPTSDLEVIKARPVGDIAADDCVLFLWATVPMLLQAAEVMAAWGFAYKTHFMWRKDRAGTGYWNRNRHEVLLVGTRGNVPCPAMGDQWESVIDAPVGAHSEKPDQFYELIEDYFPTLPKIELNARRTRASWECWGLEAPEAEPEPVAITDDGGAGVRATDDGAPLDINAAIRDGYARNAPLDALAALTGLSVNAVQQRAKRMKLGNKDRQRAAVTRANKARAGVKP